MLQSVSALSLAGCLGSLAAGAQPTRLAPRADGELDLHHIDTGRGNCTLVVAPGGRTLMIDAGAANAAPETSSEPRPSTARRPGEWQARYAMRHAKSSRLDYFLATHIHPDHVGEPGPTSPLAPGGAYRLTGVSDVDHLLPIGTLIDRAFPDYRQAPAPQEPFARNYAAYLQERVRTSRAVEAAQVGSVTQIELGASCSVRILAANARVWKGRDGATVPRPSTERTDAGWTENCYSVALRLTCGNFSYFAGGDLVCDTHDGQAPWLDVESPATRAALRTEVAAADHHGYFDACGPDFVRNLDAQVYIVQAWDVGHPGSSQMQRLTGAWSGKAAHDVFATDLLPANQLMNRRFAPLLRSTRGHVVVRVAQGGGSYRVHVLDSSTEDDRVTASFGPYTSRPRAAREEHT